jgi:hypothetical protein
MEELVILRRRDEDRAAIDHAAQVSSELYVRMFQEIGEEPWP